MPESQSVVHLSEEPRQEMVLPFDGDDKAFTLHVAGEAVVTLFSVGGFLFKWTRSGKVQRLDPSDLWQRGSMVLANQGGQWVMTTEPDENVSLIDTLVSRDARQAAAELTLHDFSPSVLQNRKKLRRMLILALLAAGVFADKILLESFADSVEQNLAQISSLDPTHNP